MVMSIMVDDIDEWICAFTINLPPRWNNLTITTLAAKDVGPLPPVSRRWQHIRSWPTASGLWGIHFLDIQNTIPDL